MKSLIKDIWKDKFKRYLFIFLFIAGIFLIAKESIKTQDTNDSKEVLFFFHPTCPHCNEQKGFNNILIEKYPEVTFKYYDVTTPEGSKLFREYADKFSIPSSELGVPGTFFGTYHFIGFRDAETTGKDIEDSLIAFLNGETSKNESQKEFNKIISLPLIGEINVLDYSLPVLAIILGLIDGFNPCAMWVLVYLISLILTLGDKKKIWLLVGSFVFASGVLYFLFMTAWLNAFLLLGYVRWLTIIIGLSAIGFGTTSLKDFFTKKELTCEVGDAKSKKKTISKIEALVNSPLTFATMFGIIGLAFVINSIEFACSSAIPAIFTQVLAISDLSPLQHYGYILLYDIFFMLDDLIIFGLAAFAVNSSIGDKYARYCKLIGGILMLAIGMMLAFMPNMLR